MFAGRLLFSVARVVADRVSTRSRSSAGLGGRNSFSDQVQFASVQEFPLNFLSGFQPNGRSQGNGKVNVEFWLLPFGTDGLHFEQISCRICWTCHI